MRESIKWKAYPKFLFLTSNNDLQIPYVEILAATKLLSFYNFDQSFKGRLDYKPIDLQVYLFKVFACFWRAGLQIFLPNIKRIKFYPPDTIR